MISIFEKQLETWLVNDQTRFYRMAYSYLQNQDDALDAVQSAVCKALEKQYTLQDIRSMRSWFYRILVNECMDQLRRRKRVSLVPTEELDIGSYEDPLPENDSLAKRVDALPPEIGVVIKLRFYEELSLKEISDIVDCPLSTVKTRLYSGLKKLRVSMEGEEF